MVELQLLAKYDLWKQTKHSLRVRRTAARWPLFVNKWHFCGFTLINWDNDKANFDRLLLNVPQFILHQKLELGQLDVFISSF